MWARVSDVERPHGELLQAIGPAPGNALVDPERGSDGGAGEPSDARSVECILAGSMSATIQHRTHEKGEKERFLRAVCIRVGCGFCNSGHGAESLFDPFRPVSGTLRFS